MRLSIMGAAAKARKIAQIHLWMFLSLSATGQQQVKSIVGTGLPPLWAESAGKKSQ